MESLMRFGRKGCRAVLEHYREWVTAKGGNGDVDDTRNQIAYSRQAKEEWFDDRSPRGKLLQDVWNNRIRNRDPARGCLRKASHETCGVTLQLYFAFAVFVQYCESAVPRSIQIRSLKST